MKPHSRQKYLSLSWLIFILLIALMPSFYLHHRVNGFLVMLVIIFGFIQFVLNPVSPKKMGLILLMPALFIVLLIGQLYTDNLKTGWTLVERSLSILLLPFATYGTRKFTEKQQRWMMLVFLSSALASSIFCLGAQTKVALEAGTIYTTEKSTHFLYNIFMHHRLSSPLGLHAVYFSSFIALINIYLFTKLFSIPKKTLKKVAIICLFIFFTIMIYLLKSAIISFGFSLTIVIVTLYHIQKVNNRISKFGLVGLVLVTIGYGFIAVQSKMEFINFNYTMTDQHMGMLAIRLSIWENAMTVIQSHWLLGVGTGDADSALLNQYVKSGFTIGSKYDYNCHNMYLQYWLGNGILGLGLFVTYFVMLFNKAIKHKNFVFLGFLIVFALFSFTESTMRVQKGMVFFMVFSSLFYWSPLLWTKKLSE